MSTGVVAALKIGGGQQSIVSSFLSSAALGGDGRLMQLLYYLVRRLPNCGDLLPLTLIAQHLVVRTRSSIAENALRSMTSDTPRGPPIAAGMDAKLISTRLGHGSTAFTFDAYGHFMPKAGTTAASAVAALVDSVTDMCPRSDQRPPLVLPIAPSPAPLP